MSVDRPASEAAGPPEERTSSATLKKTPGGIPPGGPTASAAMWVGKLRRSFFICVPLCAIMYQSKCRGQVFGVHETVDHGWLNQTPG